MVEYEKEEIIVVTSKEDVLKKCYTPVTFSDFGCDSRLPTSYPAIMRLYENDGDYCAEFDTIESLKEKLKLLESLS